MNMLSGLIGIFVCFCSAATTALLDDLDSYNEDSSTYPGSVRLGERSLSNGIQIRMSSLGASIVYGSKSSDGNGFRYGLRNQLICNGNPVTTVGCVKAGTMADNDCEAWPGALINEVAEKVISCLYSQPNLVLLYVGTEDCSHGSDDDVQMVDKRLGNLIDHLFHAIPDVTIVASTLLPNKDPLTQHRIEKFNAQLPALVKDRQAAGRKLTYVDFSSGYIALSDIGGDGTHPTDRGYLKMAEVWYQGIQVANDQGWLSAPKEVDGISNAAENGAATCNKSLSLPSDAPPPPTITKGLSRRIVTQTTIVTRTDKQEIDGESSGCMPAILMNYWQSCDKSSSSCRMTSALSTSGCHAKRTLVPSTSVPSTSVPSTSVPTVACPLLPSNYTFNVNAPQGSNGVVELMTKHRPNFLPLYSIVATSVETSIQISPVPTTITKNSLSVETSITTQTVSAVTTRAGGVCPGPGFHCIA